MLTLNQIYKTYNKGSINESILFSGFNLTVSEGQFISIVGSNGSGKSSLLNIICGSIDIDGGKILLRNKDITGKREHKRSQFIGRVFQDPAKGTCPNMSILENMSLADNKGKSYGLSAGINKKRTDYYKSLLEQLKLGLEDKINVMVGALSGGQRQALALLTSTMTPIDLLILDEHTAALDPKTSENIMELTDRIVKSKGITTLMVTHNLRFAVNYGNRILMMHNGEIVIDATDTEKQKIGINKLLEVFNEISIECGN
ncbi:ABC transporter related protein [Desulforamulus reducens MI-1]|uniref:ABC transporter related protein n=1 Tax=Desulforamulus reducens (strain ATCC BAA-1160 / DSM 100696 / MI-1) TaxID=349161 RepID=A4J6N5_DESRM|nr:ATP-binding cassette domain-containing protein [Desulforamulus reducens]ABO50738.1 ABC transporter related protein [Desulforamulus reducens MI-1]